MTGQNAAATPIAPLPPPLAYLKRVLRRYYVARPPAPPARFGRREFGFIAWPHRPGPPPFVRHVAFRTRAEYDQFIRRRVPWHFYYSSAFYQDPAERRMVDKGWLGAELVFDLDADHLPGAKELTFEEQLRAVKVEFVKLINEFILGDLGFDADDVTINFSGGRGYHCHVMASDALGLDARGRRQIADYVTGKGVEARDLVRVVTRRTGPVDRMTESRHLVLPDPADPGWRGRVARGVVAFCNELRDIPLADAERRLVSYPGIGPTRASRFLARIRDDTRDAAGTNVLDRVQGGWGDQGAAFAQVLNLEAVKRGIVELAEGETDEPVTADTKRLIRMPDSLHGKTGLLVQPITLDGLKDYDPLKDAVALEWDAQDTVIAPRPASFSLRGESFRLPENDPVALPRAAAFFAVARRLAVPADEPAPA
jgi:DNA primase small subunit